MHGHIRYRRSKLIRRTNESTYLNIPPLPAPRSSASPVRVFVRRSVFDRECRLINNYLQKIMRQNVRYIRRWLDKCSVVIFAVIFIGDRYWTVIIISLTPPRPKFNLQFFSDVYNIVESSFSPRIRLILFPFRLSYFFHLDFTTL